MSRISEEVSFLTQCFRIKLAVTQTLLPFTPLNPLVTTIITITIQTRLAVLIWKIYPLDNLTSKKLLILILRETLNLQNLS